MKQTVRHWIAAAALSICLIGVSTSAHSTDHEILPISLPNHWWTVVQHRVQTALGIRYVLGGHRPDRGFDCAGLVYWAFSQTTIYNLPRTSYDLARLGQPIALSDLEPGDLVFYNTRGRPNSHVGIYMGNGEFVHAPRTGRRVGWAQMQNQYWRNRFTQARRLHTDITI